MPQVNVVFRSSRDNDNEETKPKAETGDEKSHKSPKKTIKSTPNKPSPVTLTQHWGDDSDNSGENTSEDGNDDMIRNELLVSFLKKYRMAVEIAVKSVRNLHQDYAEDAFLQERFYSVELMAAMEGIRAHDYPLANMNEKGMVRDVDGINTDIATLICNLLEFKRFKITIDNDVCNKNIRIWTWHTVVQNDEQITYYAYGLPKM